MFLIEHGMVNIGRDHEAARLLAPGDPRVDCFDRLGHADEVELEAKQRHARGWLFRPRRRRDFREHVTFEQIIRHASTRV